MQKAMNASALVVSIHDVSPLTWERTVEILEDLRGCGVTAVSLLVIPDHHGKGRISASEGFGEWLAARVAGGDEAVLHGYFHVRARGAADGLGKRLVTESYTAGEGEFFDLDYDAAKERLRNGRRELASCGVGAAGFIAPAWLLGRQAEEAVRDEGFEYTTRISVLRDFRSGRDYSSRSLVWSVRAGWRRVCSLAWNRVLAGAVKGAPLCRIGIHPPDWEHRAVRGQILELTRAMLAGRQAMTYQEWVTLQRHDQ
jgi:predicted deacetylase